MGDRPASFGDEFSNSMRFGASEDNSQKEPFVKRAKSAVGKSGRRKCATFWRFVTSDGTTHTVRIVHNQTLDQYGESKRIIRVDGTEHYNKVSNASNFHFEICEDTIIVSILPGEEQEGEPWLY